MPCNEADGVRSARLKGKKCRHKVKNLTIGEGLNDKKNSVGSFYE